MQDSPYRSGSLEDELSTQEAGGARAGCLISATGGVINSAPVHARRIDHKCGHDLLVASAIVVPLPCSWFKASFGHCVWWKTFNYLPLGKQKHKTSSLITSIINK